METYKNRGSVLSWLAAWIIYFPLPAPTSISPDQVRNSYQLCNNGTLRVMYANGMGVSFHSEPHVLAGTITPTIGRCNISLPMENGLNSIEWRLRKEQIKGKVTIFGRKLRVSHPTQLIPAKWQGTPPFLRRWDPLPSLHGSFLPWKRHVSHIPRGLRSQGKCSAFSRMEKVGIYLQLKVEIPFGVLPTLTIVSVNFHHWPNLTSELLPMPYCVLH